MGIRGLTGFIDKNQHLLHQHQLQGCTVIVDGNNFYHYLYHACHVHCHFGGDYDVYRTKVISTFQSLKECGITPYVVLDGAYTVDSRKLKTSLSRAVARIRLVDSIANGYSGQALPVLAYETFVQVMIEMGIRHAMCQFEADAEIATLANQLQCPVISNDSDFYIFDLGFGFLPLDYIDFRPVRRQSTEGKSTHSYLHCYKYHVDDFIGSFDGLSRSTLPIFATLLGNDVIEASAFSTFYARFKVPKLVSKKFSLPSRMTKVISVLHWLHTQADDGGIDQVRDQLLRYVTPEKRTIVGRLFDKAVRGYTEVNSFEGCDLFQYFTTDAISPIKSSSDFRYYNGKCFPEWFLVAVCKGELTSHILNTAVLHRVILVTQVETLSLNSSFNTSSFLRSFLYAVLLKGDSCNSAREQLEQLAELPSSTDLVLGKSLNTDSACVTVLCEPDSKADHGGGEGVKEDDIDVNEPCEIESDEGEKENEDDQNEVLEALKETSFVYERLRIRPRKTVVEEYTRINKQLKKNVFDVSHQADNLQVPDLKQLPCLSLDQKRDLIYKAFDTDPTCVENFPDKLKVFALCIIAWIRRCDPRVTFSQFDSILLCVLFLAARRELKQRKRKYASNDSRNYEGHGPCDAMLKSSQRNYNVESVCSQTEVEHLKAFTSSLEKYHKAVPVFNRSNLFNTVCCHVFAQLQALLVDACHLNRTLQQPLPNPRPAELINGTLLYNLTEDISSRANSELFVSLMFGEGGNASSFKDLYRNLRCFFLEENKLADLLVTPVQARGRHKRKRNKKKEPETTPGPEEAGSEQEGGASATQEGEEFSEFAANNKFSLLMLCD